MLNLKALSIYLNNICIKGFILGLFLSITFYANAQEVKPVWGRQIVNNWETGMVMSVSYFIESDQDGNLYLIKDFPDSVWIHGTSYFSQTKSSSILVKFNAMGEVIWTIPWTNNADRFDVWQLLNVDPSTILITGFYYGKFKVSDSIELDSLNKSRSTYFMSVDSSSKINWAKSVYGATLDLRLSASGDIWFLAKSLGGNSYTLFDSTISGDYSTIGKINKNGELLLLKRVSSYVDGFCVDQSDNIYVTGLLGKTLQSVKLDTTTIVASSQDRDDIFIAKFNSQLQLE